MRAQKGEPCKPLPGEFALGAAPDVDRVQWSSGYDDDGKGVRKPLTLGRFGVDVYEYPSPFLLLPVTLRQVVPGFRGFRLVWFISTSSWSPL